MLQRTVHHICDGLESAMWVVRGALGLAGRVLHRAHVVQQNEGIDKPQVNLRECPPHLETGALEHPGRVGNGHGAALVATPCVYRVDSWERGWVLRLDGWHLFLPWGF